MASPAPTPTPAPANPAKKTSGSFMSWMDVLMGLETAPAKQKVPGAPPSSSDDTLSDPDKLAIKHYQEGLQKTLDLISPSGIEVKNNEIVLNDLHVRTLYVYNWPNYIYPNWLSHTINIDAQMDIAQFIYPTSNKSIMKMLRRKVAELRSSIRVLEQRGVVRDPSLEAALQDAEELRDLLARGQEKLFQFGMYVTLYAESEEKLKKLQTDIESILGGKLVLSKPAIFQMEHAWNSTLPLCLDELEISRNMNTSPLATSFPFTSSNLTDDHGILYGINRHNDSLILFDRFDLPNANANVFATSGAGKSFTVKLEILRALMYGTDVIVIDPENEYVDLCKTVGGSFVPMSLQSAHSINPFDLPKSIHGEETERGEVLRAAAINLHGLFRLILGTLTPSEDGVLDKVILDTYALKGITLETEHPETLEPPTMHDIVDVLMTTQGGENMAMVIQKYTDGSFAGIFNNPTNVELDKQMVVFQIRDLEEQLRPVAIYIILNYIWNRIRGEMKKRFLVIDEAWNLMQHEDSARFLYGLVKRARKYFLGITTITQDVEDFVNSPFGKPILTNSSLQILLRQSPTAIDNMQKLFYLTEGEKYLLLNSGVGQGIFFAGNKHVAIQVVASPEETRIVTTKPEEVLAKIQEQHAKDLETIEAQKTAAPLPSAPVKSILQPPTPPVTPPAEATTPPEAPAAKPPEPPQAAAAAPASETPPPSSPSAPPQSEPTPPAAPEEKPKP
ncbi:MAG: ATP-binding protein [Candidatus Peregrinibacteria bacterium]|nr:ATP-binding protein [Candidatus Peregrinibacteria bacterium]